MILLENDDDEHDTDNGNDKTNDLTSRLHDFPVTFLYYVTCI